MFILFVLVWVLLCVDEMDSVYFYVVIRDGKFLVGDKDFLMFNLVIDSEIIVGEIYFCDVEFNG